MEFFVRLIQVLVKIFYFFIYHLLSLLPKPKQQIPPITNRLLCLPLVKLTILMQERQLTSEHLVSLYIERIKAVNPHINAIVQERFEEAMVQAKRADEFNAKCKNREQIFNLYRRFPMLGVPFTVKESCGLKGMSFVVGSLQRANERATQNGHTVDLLCAAGGIPLLVSANPEFCFSIETNTFTHGKCLNPYNSRRTPGGSSGGEGALNGAGATLFGIGSDIAGSIRIPALFNGVFGHKPTAGVTSVVGHFPYCDDKDFGLMLQCGPITRFAQDLGLIMHVMAGDKAHKLDLLSEVKIKQVKIHYALGFTGLNGLMHPSVVYDLEFAIVKAVKYFQMLGLKVERADIKSFQNSTEIALSAIVRLHSMPFLMNDEKAKKVTTNLKEYAKSFVGKSQYTKDGLIFELMRRTNAFMAEAKLEKYKLEVEKLKEEILQLLGDDGVLLFPTFHVPAIHHHSSHLPLWGIDYALIFNVLGLPCTNIPMGVDGKGLPLGFQVIAAPYQDRMCFQIAVQLENFFGGWTPPTPNAFKEVAKRNSLDRRRQAGDEKSS